MLRGTPSSFTTGNGPVNFFGGSIISVDWDGWIVKPFNLLYVDSSFVIVWILLNRTSRFGSEHVDVLSSANKLVSNLSDISGQSLTGTDSAVSRA